MKKIIYYITTGVLLLLAFISVLLPAIKFEYEGSIDSLGVVKMSIFSFLSASSITNTSSGGSILGAVLVIGIFFVSTVLPILDKKIASFIGICSSLLIAGVFIGLLSDLKNSGLTGSVSFTGIYIIIIVSFLAAMYNIVSLIDFKTISLNIIKKESKSKESRLRELQSLKEQELISEEEYQKKRTEVINE